MQKFYKILVILTVASLLVKITLYLVKFINIIYTESKTNILYTDHFCAIIGFPIAVYISTVVTSITGLALLYSDENEIVVFGFKSVKSIGLVTLWLFVFIVSSFAIKFMWKDSLFQKMIKRIAPDAQAQGF